jgi:AraC-like DNA-binding protein/quercetin dioxygenase-like cupin family protein
MSKNKILDEEQNMDRLVKLNHMFAREFTFADNMMEHEMHAHEFGILTCVKKGIVKMTTPSDSWIVSNNTIFYIPPDIVHSSEIIGECEILVVFIPTQLVKILPKKLSVLELTPLLDSVFDRMTSWDLKVDYNKEQKHLVKVAEDEIKAAKVADYFHIPIPRNEKLKKMAKKILQSPEDMSPIDNWAKFTGMSIRSFTRHFTEETGLSFTEWRQKVKIYNALKMLTENVPVNDVSFNLGYQNVSTFITMFKGHIGCSPTEYIKNTKMLKG